mgnify:CR=1 FL=1
MCNEAKYVVIMISESYAWAGYGETEEDAKEMIRENYSKIMRETSIKELEVEYGFCVMECGQDHGIVITL